MDKHEEKFCPRCGRSFECKLGSILLCQCSQVTLTEEERAHISTNFEDCLCADCIKKMKKEYHQLLFKERLRKISRLFNT